MEIFLWCLLYEIYLLYLDGFAVLGKTFTEGQVNLEGDFSQLQKVN